MGAVWLAEQLEPVQRKVAVKLIRWENPSLERRSRFQMERQAMALMSHPNVAAILEAGETEHGQPFFAMEWVDGQRITRYCDRQNMGIERRLELFLAVCDGLQHAHQKGIIHRDIKPANVMVCEVDQEPIVKIIDFGLAKATSEYLTDLASHDTNVGQILGTLRYMSPEQAALNPHQVDTRTDIYSLGVLLHELLTGTTPLDAVGADDKSTLQLLQLIQEAETPRPSQTLELSSESAESASRCRNISSVRLTQLLSGDLDWIVIKALEKEPARRYPTVAAMAEDVQCFLQGLPIAARPPSWTYQAGKFVRRNRVPVTAALTLALALIIALAGTAAGLSASWRAEARLARERDATKAALLETEAARASESRRAASEQQARELAQQRATKLKETVHVLRSIFRDLNLESTQPSSEPIAQILAKRIQNVAESLHSQTLLDDPDEVLALQVDLGRTLLGLGYPRETLELFDSKNPWLERLPEESVHLPIEMLRVQAHIRLGEHQKALEIVDRNRSLWQQPAIHDPAHYSWLHLAGVAHLAAGDSEQALQLIEEAIAATGTLGSADDLTTVVYRNNYAMALSDAGKHREASQIFQDVHEQLSVTLGSDHLKTLIARRNGLFEHPRMSTELVDQARALHLQFQQTAGVEHPETLTTEDLYASTLFLSGQREKALQLLEHSWEIQKQRLGTSPNVSRSGLRLVQMLINRGMLSVARKRLDSFRSVEEPELRDRWLGLESQLELAAGNETRGLQLLAQCLQQQQKRYGPQHSKTLGTECKLLEIKITQGNAAAHIEELGELLKRCKEHLPEGHSLCSEVEKVLALAYFNTRQLDKARALYQKIHDEWVQNKGRNHPDAILLRHNLAGVKLESGNIESALQDLEQICEELNELGLNDDPDTIRCRTLLSAAYFKSGRIKEALQIAEQDYRQTKGQLGIGNPIYLNLVHNYGYYLMSSNQAAKALPIMQDLVEQQSQLYGVAHTRTLSSLNNLAGVHNGLGQIEECSELLEQCWIRSRDQWGPQSQATRKALNGLIKYRQKHKLFAETIVPAQAWLKLCEEESPNSNATFQALNSLAYCYYQTGQAQHAIPLLERTREWCVEQFGADDQRVLAVDSRLGMAHLQNGNPTKALERLEKVQNAGQTLSPEMQTAIRQALLQAGETKRYQQVVDGKLAESTARPMDTQVDYYLEIIQELRSSGQPELARQYLQQALAIPDLQEASTQRERLESVQNEEKPTNVEPGEKPNDPEN